MADEKKAPTPQAAAPSSAAVDVKAAVSEVRQTNLAAENEALKQQLANLKKQASASKPVAPKAPFDLVGALKTVNPEYLTFLEKELATAQSPETKFGELAKQLPHFFRAKRRASITPRPTSSGFSTRLAEWEHNNRQLTRGKSSKVFSKSWWSLWYKKHRRAKSLKSDAKKSFNLSQGKR